MRERNVNPIESSHSVLQFSHKAATSGNVADNEIYDVDNVAIVINLNENSNVSINKYSNCTIS